MTLSHSPLPAETPDQLRARLLRCPKVHASIRKVARSKKVPPPEVDDVLQDTLARVSVATLPRVEDEARRYINGIAKNVAIDHLRVLLENPTEPLEEIGRDVVAPDPDVVEKRSTGDALLDKGRQVFGDKFDWFVRAKVKDESTVEIARSAGVTPGHVRDEVSIMTRFLRDHGRASGLGVVILMLAAVALVLRPPPQPAQGAPWTPDEHYVVDGVPLDAAALRDRGKNACDAGAWEACAHDLDAALALDPDGETAEARVLRERAAEMVRVRDAQERGQGPR
jgi:DNA-directed RNA polymerase specialized sigma24 family protein